MSILGEALRLLLTLQHPRSLCSVLLGLCRSRRIFWSEGGVGVAEPPALQDESFLCNDLFGPCRSFISVTTRATTRRILLRPLFDVPCFEGAYGFILQIDPVLVGSKVRKVSIPAWLCAAEWESPLKNGLKGDHTSQSPISPSALHTFPRDWEMS